MSELPPRSRLTFEERQERTKLRRKELEPALSRLAVAAKSAYATLRPLAEHVGSVDREHPLRHQQIQVMGVGGPGGVVADYLMVAFGNHHDLTLYRNYENGRRFVWRFERSALVDSLVSEQTTVEEFPRSRQLSAGDGVMEIEVATYTYPEQVGINGMYTDSLCDYFTEYAGADNYIRAFEADLEAAVTRFS